MIFPSIYVFTSLLISTSYGDEEDDFCKGAYEFHDAYNCSSYATGPTDLAKIDDLEIVDATDQDYDADHEKKFSLHCCFYSQPYCPKIKWYKDGVEVKYGLTIQKIDGGRTLEVHATSDSGGKYTCNATTPYGESASHSISVSVSRRCTGNYSVITSPSQGVIKVPKGSRQTFEWSFICFGKLHIAAVTCKRNNSVEITDNDNYYNITRIRSEEPNNKPALKHTITILYVSRSENISCRTDDNHSPTATFLLMMEEEVNAEPQLGSSFFQEKGVWIVIGVSLLLSFVAVLFLLWYRRRVSRRELKYYNHKEKEMKVLYDAFISFSEDDGGSFVRSTLQPMLEDECGYTLSLHYREFLPGAPIVDSIINCIYDSRRIVVVVTPKFLKSEWCKFEVHQGLRRAIKRPNSLIVVMLNEMPLARLPKPLRSFLSDVTFLLWDDGKREEMRKKMKRALGTPYTVKSVDGQAENIGIEISAEEKDAGKSERNGKKCNPSVQVSSDNESVNIV